VQKAALLAGFPPDNVRSIPSDERFRVRVDLLEQRILEDREAERLPFMIVGNAGTTNTGAVDNLPALAEVAQRGRLWFHVDAAYGGCFLLTEYGRAVMKGIERADSVTLDPHKGLFLPYGTGSLLVKDGPALKRAHGVSAAYLPSTEDEGELVDFSQMSPELSREIRGLRVWLPFKMHGAAPFRRNLEEKLALTQWATKELCKIPGVEIVAEPQLSVVAFRFVRPGVETDALNQLNRQLLQQINARNRVHLSGTTLNGHFVLRICVLSFRTHLDRVQMCLEDIRAAVGALGA
jgi:aromatic-L-amino-acid decarboxylase